MWFYSIKNIKKDFSELEIDELKEITLKMFRMDCKFSRSHYTNFELPIYKEKEQVFDKNNFFSIKDITNYISRANAEAQQKSRRSTIDFNELEQLSDGRDDTNDLVRAIGGEFEFDINDRENRSEENSSPYFDQPIPCYDEVRIETQSLKFDSIPNSNNISFTLSRNIDMKMPNSGHK